MKIALVSPYDFPYPGGVTEHTAALASGLQRRGCAVTVLAASSGYQGLTFPNLQVITRNVTRIPVGGAVARVGLSPRAYGRLKKILTQEKFDVIHLQEPLTPSLTWWTLLLARTWPHTVTVGTFHAHHELPNWLYARGRPLFAKFFARLDALIAVSEAARQFASAMFPGHYTVIPNGIDLARFGANCNLERHLAANPARTILFVGRLDWRKGFHRLLDSFIRLKPEYPHLRLVVVGPFEAKACRPYQRLARRHGVTDGLEFVGYVPPAHLPAMYQQADIFCAPSMGFESFGIILLEAMAAGLPLVASDIAGYRSVVTYGQDGWLVSPDSPTELDNALRQLLNNSSLRYKMGQNGSRKAQQYSWEQIIDQILALYQETIERKRMMMQPQPTLTAGLARNRYGQAVPQPLEEI